MKVKLCLSILLISMLGTLFAPSLARAEPIPLQWSKIDVPGINGNVVVNPSEVSEIAIGSGIFYALDTENFKIYRSRNDGVTWEDISKYLMQGGAVLPATKIAIAPDAPGILAVVTNSGTKVFLSIDGGITWVNANVPTVAGTIQAIAISGQYTENDYTCWDVVIGTATWGDGLTMGQVWLLKLGIASPSWQNLGLRVDPNFVGGEVSAIAFSSAYADDQTVVVVASTNLDVAAAYQNGTFLCLGQPGTPFWNARPGYPVQIAAEGDAVGLTQVVSMLALPANYSNAISAPSSARKAFVSFDRQPTLLLVDDVYRIDDTIPVRLNVAGGGNIDISSISLSGSKLLAGLTVNIGLYVPVYLTSNAFDSPPTWQPATQPPSGPGNAKVSWGSGGIAYCGTGQSPTVPLDESAFSVSIDGGDTWMQISLIDTMLTIQDIAVAPSPASLFMTTTSPMNIESVWRSAGEPLGEYWGRVLVIDASSNKVIVRLSPNYRDDYTLYVAEVDNPPNPNDGLIWVTNDRGNSWRGRHAPSEVVDMVVADSKVVYVGLNDGTVSKSTNGAKSWQIPVDTNLTQINMLYLAGNETLLVGGRKGDVAYSTDAGNTFTIIPKTVDSSPIQVVADANYMQNGIIYAGSGNVIYRWTISSSDNWQVMRELTTNRQISGMVVVDGVLYGAWFDATNGSGTERCLEPTVPLMVLEWDTLKIGAEVAKFDATPTSLRFLTDGTGNYLWTIDTAASTLMIYLDCLAKKGPVISAPEIIGCDPVTGRNQEINLTWEQLCLAKKYDILVAKDSDFTLLVYENWGYEPFSVTSPALIIPAGNDNFECGHTYYWKVRVSHSAVGDEQIRSPWSEDKSFQIKAGLPVTTPDYGIQALAPVNGDTAFSIKGASFSWSGYSGATEYQFQLAEDAAISNILADARVSTTAYSYHTDLGYSKNYYWRVRATKPVESDWSSVFSLMTEKALPQSSSVDQSFAQTTESSIPLHLLWSMIGTGAALAISLLVLIVRTRR